MKVIWMKLRYWISFIAVLVIVSLYYFHNEIKIDSEVGTVEIIKEIEIDNKVDYNHIFIPVLMYHHFVEQGEETSYTTITNKEFEEQIIYLKEQGYNTITDQDLIDFYYNGKKLPEKPIHITMDDGYESNYRLAYPILKENGMKATIFVIVSRIDREYSLPRLTWNQLKEMSDEGVMSIQSHTYDLHHKENVDAVEVSAAIADNSEEHYKRVLSDFNISKRLIEGKLGKKVHSISYPFGHYDENTISAVEASGYKLAYTVKSGLNTIDTNPFELMRINVSPGWTGETIEQEIENQRKLLEEISE